MNIKRHYGWIIALAFLGLIPGAKGQQPVKIKLETGNALGFYIGEELVTRYHTSGFAKPIFWPVNAPGSVPLTRNYPPPPGQATDHPHQKSAWFCHGDIIPEGIELKSKIKGVEGVDFWSEAKGHGVITNSRTAGFEKVKGVAYLAVKNKWQTAEGQKIMDDSTIIRLHDLGKARLIVVEIDLHASVCPITFGDTKEGCFGIRINDVINAGKNGKGKIQNAEGIVAEKIAKEEANKTWGLKSAWCDYSGPIDGKLVGLAIFDDPKNPYPACWHVRGYGLMAANPFGRDKHAKFPAMKGNDKLVRLEKGEHLQLRYGMLLHTGDAVSGEVAKHYQRFVELRGKE